MKNTGLVLSGLIVAMVAGVSGYYWQQELSSSDDGTEVKTKTKSLASPGEMQGKERPGFSLPDRHGQVRNVSEWDGQVLVINFWATWCPPCRDEIPGFVELQEQYGARGLQFIGIALEKAEDVTEFAEEMGINYPVLAAELDAIKIAEQYGNRIGALPYTVIIDRDRIIRHVQQGVLSHDRAEALITALL